MGIKLENVKTTDFTINFPEPNGHEKTFFWSGVYGTRRSILEIPEEVYEWLRYRTTTFQHGYLIVAKEEPDKQVKDEVKAVQGNVTIYTVEQIKKLLKGKVTDLKKEIDKTTSKDIILEFVRVAKEMKLDSDSIKTYLADLLGYKDNKEALFPVE